MYGQVFAFVVEDVAEPGRRAADEQILPWCVDHNAVWATPGVRYAIIDDRGDVSEYLLSRFFW